jgi:gamma-glutamylcyclotransferase (GGCT)/AIG2-like uncharacterized protein YtfP
MTPVPHHATRQPEPPVFVYGSLKAAQSNHHWLAAAPFLGRRRLSGAVLHERQGFPMALLTGTATDVVHGELYALSGDGLARLDQLEDYPHDYDRSLCILSSGERAWVYHGRLEQVEGTPRVALGDWRSTPVFHPNAHLDRRRLAACCPLWDGLQVVARLDGWSRPVDSCTVEGMGAAGQRPRPDQQAWGVVTHLQPADLERLDASAGLSDGRCTRTLVPVLGRCGARFTAHTYRPG